MGNQITFRGKLYRCQAKALHLHGGLERYFKIKITYAVIAVLKSSFVYTY